MKLQLYFYVNFVVFRPNCGLNAEGGWTECIAWGTKLTEKESSK